MESWENDINAYIFSALCHLYRLHCFFFFILFFSTHFSCFLDLNISLFPHPSPPFSTHSSSVTSPIQSGDERCTTSSPACQLRTSIAPWAEGKTKIILFAEIPSRNISSGKGAYLLAIRKQTERNHVKTTIWTHDNNNALFVTLRGFLIILHILRKSFHLKLQPAGSTTGSKAVMTFLTA